VQFDGSGFDATRVQNASVVKTASGYALLYAGLTFGNNYQVGLATSSDGLNWSKYSDNPVISNGGSQSWASFRELPATLMLDNGVYKLWFNGDNSNLSSDPGYKSGFGYATSIDGINWSFDANNPIRFELNSPSGNGIDLDEVVKLNGQYIAYYVNHNPSGDVLNYAVSADGIHFSNDAPLGVPGGYALLAATTANIGGTNTVFAVLQDSIGIDHYATSTDGANFTIGGIVNVPSNFGVTDVLFDGSQIKFFGDNGVGNVNWSFGNINIEYATALVSSLAGNTGALAGGNDSITGGPGNDTIDGGAGLDTAIFSGLRSAYSLLHVGNTLQVSGPDGNDTLTNIERLAFDDVLVPSVTPHDASGDAKSDILWHKNDGTTAIFDMNDSQVLSANVVGQQSTAWTIAGTGDFNGDGKSDILWHEDDGTTVIFDMNDSQILSANVIGQPSTAWTIAGTGDFNGDGKSDILWHKDDGTTVIFDMNDSQVLSANVVGQPSTAWTIAGTGDFNGDGKSDILWHKDDGTTVIFDMNDNQVLSANVVAQPSTTWTIAGTGDFNGDGKSDILWHKDDGTTVIFDMNDSQVLSANVVGQPSTAWKVAGTGDFNGDGKSDILWHKDDGTTVIFDMNDSQVLSATVVAQPSTDWHIV
jgi:hypothetical protein